MADEGVYQRMFERERKSRKRAEELLETMSGDLFAAYSQLKKSSDEVLAIFRSVTDGIITFDSSGTIEALNPSIERIFGHTEKQLLGRNIRLLLPKSVIDFDLDDSYWVERCTEEQPKLSTQGVHADRHVFEMELSASRATQPGKEIFVWVIRNTHQIRNVERRIALGQRLEAIGQLAAGVSHEINTPIQYVHENTMFLRDAFRVFEETLSRTEQAMVVNGSAENTRLQELFRHLCDEYRLDFYRREVPKAIEETIHGSKRVSAIVQAIREFAHPGNSEMNHLDLNRAITSAITLATNRWRSECEIVLELEPKLPLVLCHVSEINQVILNLLVNACDAIAESRSPSSPLGRITFRTWLENNCIKLSIQDTGVGIKQENLERIFTMFFTTKAVGKGTGQGLALVYSIIVERHRGSIDVDSKPGEGSTFLIALPLVPKS